jgi:hypothetical protein
MVTPPKPKFDTERLQDIFYAETCEILVDHKNTLWLNVNGRCVFRIAYAEVVIIERLRLGGGHPREILHSNVPPDERNQLYIDAQKQFDEYRSKLTPPKRGQK